MSGRWPEPNCLCVGPHHCGLDEPEDARLASEDARECDGGCGSVGPNGGRCQGCDHGQYTRAPTEEAALPSPSGPDAETLAAPSAVLMLAKRRLAKPNGDWSINDWRAVASGLVALVEQRERDKRLDAGRVAEQSDQASCIESLREWAYAEHLTLGFSERQLEVQALLTLLARHRQALERIAAHPHGGILVNIARRALAASAPGTEEDTDGT